MIHELRYLFKRSSDRKNSGSAGAFNVWWNISGGLHPESGTFTPTLITESNLNITYNYGHYYYEIYEENGIRAIYGVSGFDSIFMLEKIIAFLNEKYKKEGEWVKSKRNKTIYYDENGNEIKDIITIINENIPVRKEEVEFEVSEGDTSDYWLDTAANAIKPLYELIALAKMRPDCIWDGD